MVIARFESFYCSDSSASPEPATVWNPEPLCTTHLEQQLPSLVCPDAALSQRVTELVSKASFRRYLEEPIRDFSEKEKLEREGWEPLSPSVCGHRDLKGWLIKGNYINGRNNKVITIYTGGGSEDLLPGRYDNLQRPLMGEILKKGAEEAGLKLAVPREYLVPIPNPTGRDLRNRFFVISERLDLAQDQAKIWRDLKAAGRLEETVRKICRFIVLTGFADASVSNLCFTTDGTLAAIDTEGTGLLQDPEEVSKESGDGIYRIYKCALGGFEQFAFTMHLALFSDLEKARREGCGGLDEIRSSNAEIQELVRTEVEKAKKEMDTILDYRSERQMQIIRKIHSFSKPQPAAEKPKPLKSYNWGLIIGSILSGGLVPLALLIESLFHSCCCTKSRA